MDWLSKRINLLRWFLSVTAFFVVFIQQIIEHTWLKDLSWPQHFASQLIFYGIVGPTVVWIALTWIARSVAERERASRQVALLHDLSQQLAAATDDELLQIVVRAPTQVVDAVGCSFTAVDDHTGQARLEAVWGLNSAYAEALQQRLATADAYRRCRHCVALRATLSQTCSVLVPEQAAAAGIASVICLPLARGEKFLGHLNVFLARTEPLPADKVRLLNAMAAEMVPAIEAARLRNRALATLYQVDQTIRARLDLDGLLTRILDQALDACEARWGAILLADESSGDLRSRVVRGDPILVRRIHELEEQFERTAETVIVPKLGAGKGANPGEIGSAVCVPLTVDEERLGLLCLGHAQPGRFTDRHVQLLSAIASQAALIVQNARLYARLERQAILEERARLAREMHDGLAQDLGYLSLKTQQAMRRLKRGQVEDVERELAEIRAAIRDLYVEIRTAIDGLRIPLHEDQPLVPALRTYAEAFTRQTGILVTVEAESPLPTLAPAVEAQILRIVQEGLTNVRKHAAAEHAWVRLCLESDALQVIVADDGRGFDPHVRPAPDHLGLQIMRERAQALGGRLHISSAPGRGTQVRVTVPLKYALPWQNESAFAS